MVCGYLPFEDRRGATLVRRFMEFVGSQCWFMCSGFRVWVRDFSSHGCAAVQICAWTAAVSTRTRTPPPSTRRSSPRTTRHPSSSQRHCHGSKARSRVDLFPGMPSHRLRQCIVHTVSGLRHRAVFISSTMQQGPASGWWVLCTCQRTQICSNS